MDIFQLAGSLGEISQTVLLIAILLWFILKQEQRIDKKDKKLDACQKVLRDTLREVADLPPESLRINGDLSEDEAQ